MAVASLGIQIGDFRDAACAEIYGGSGYTSLDTAEKAIIDRVRLDAERNCFLHPPVGESYVWTCLKRAGAMTLWEDIAVAAAVTVTGVHAAGSTTVTATGGTPFYPTMVGHSIVITTVGTFTITSYTSSTVIVVSGNATASAKTFSITGDGVYTMPAEFESPASHKLIWMESIWMDEPRLIDANFTNQLRSRDSSTGYPQWASLRWRTSDGTAAQLQERIIYPRCSDDFDVALPYRAQPQGMSDANPYPLGGPEMADLLLASVIAHAQKEREGQRGDRWGEYVEKARVAVQRDRTQHHNFTAGFMRPDAGQVNRPFNVKDLIGTATGV